MRVGAWAAIVCALFSGLALANPVTLSAKRGDFSVSGELRSFDGLYYRVLTDAGPITLRAEAVECSGSACPAAGTTTGFTMAVAHSLADVLVPALIRAFAADLGMSVEVEKSGTQVAFRLSGQGTQRGGFPIKLRMMSASETFADLAAQASDLAIVDRSISEAELTILSDAGLGNMAEPSQEMLLALDGLAVAVSPQRRETEVSLDALAEAAASPEPRWSDLGFGEDAPLALMLRAQGEDMARLTAFLGPFAAPVEYRLDASAVARGLRTDQSHLGILPASALGATRGLRLKEPCGLGHAPSSAQMAMGRYPWVVPVKTYKPDLRPPQELMKFVGFLSTDTAARVVRRAGFARPSSEFVLDDLAERALAGLRLSAPSTLPRLQALVARLSLARQIAVSVPARTETGPMRGVQRLALQELARGLRAGDVEASEIIFVASGPDAATARVYAQAVIDRLSALAPEHAQGLTDAQIEIDGALLPVACQGAPWADWMNARVDVWLLEPTKGTLRPEN